MILKKNSHGHFKCEKCGKVYDIPLKKRVN